MYHGGLEFHTLLNVYAVSVVRFQFYFLMDNYMTESVIEAKFSRDRVQYGEVIIYRRFSGLDILKAVASSSET
jgi:hypothetical protein